MQTLAFQVQKCRPWLFKYKNADLGFSSTKMQTLAFQVQKCRPWLFKYKNADLRPTWSISLLTGSTTSTVPKYLSSRLRLMRPTPAPQSACMTCKVTRHHVIYVRSHKSPHTTAPGPQSAAQHMQHVKDMKDTGLHLGTCNILHDA
jgi:hypothetical protein